MQRFSLAGLARRYLTGATLIRLVPISIVLVSGVVLTTWTHRLPSEHRDLVVHTHEVIEMAKDVLIGLDDAETGQRGYLLSGEHHTFEPYAHARERLGTMDAIRREIGQITEGEKALLTARGVEVQADESRVQLVAVLIGLASLLTQGHSVLPYRPGRERQGDVTAVWRRPSSFVEVALCHSLSCLPHLPKCLTRAVPKASATACGTCCCSRSWPRLRARRPTRRSLPLSPCSVSA